MRNDHRNATLDTALRDAEEKYVAANPRSRAIDERAAQFMPGGNTRTVLHFSPFPLTFSGYTTAPEDWAPPL